MFGKIFVTNW